MSTASTVEQVPVQGGTLVVHELSPGAGPEAPVVLAAHGITANALMWQPVADELARRRAGVRFLAPDLRGRAESRGVTGPFGLAAHAADLLAVAAAVGARPLLLGHSMGAFVVGLTAATAPRSVSAAVLVDGGPAFPAPPDLDIDAALGAVIGPAMARLSMRFPSPGAYRDFWREHPALGPLLEGPGAEAVEAYLAHDLHRTDDGDWASTCVLDAVRADGADVIADARTHRAPWTAVEQGVPVEMLWAARGLLAEPQGLYDEERLAALALPQGVRVTGVDADHYGIVLTEPGTVAVANAVLRMVGAVSHT